MGGQTLEVSSHKFIEFVIQNFLLITLKSFIITLQAMHSTITSILADDIWSSFSFISDIP